VQVLAASMQHADRAKPEQLDGEPATLLQPLLSRLAAATPSRGGRLVILPLFIGPSRAVLLDLPAAVAAAAGPVPHQGGSSVAHGGPAGVIGGREVLIGGPLGGDEEGVEGLARLLATEVTRRGR
jgi:sirohydrochlorin ferrochelatase